MADRALRPETLERFKLLSDLMTQIATLSSGSIVVMGTFLQDFSQHARDRGLAKSALVGFLVSIIFALTAKFAVSASVSPKQETQKYWSRVSWPSIVVASLAMVGSLIFIAVFAFHNLG